VLAGDLEAGDGKIEILLDVSATEIETEIGKELPLSLLLDHSTELDFDPKNGVKTLLSDCCYLRSRSRRSDVPDTVFLLSKLEKDSHYE
jgi:hypothetical protein